MAVRPRFDPKRPLVAARDFTFHGKKYEAGHAFGPFDPGLVSDRMRARQYEARRVNFGEGTTAEEPAASPIQMTGPKGGRYTITAPWLEEPEVVRGKVKAEKRLAELQAEGAPLGFIEGGSEVTVEGGEGGWYEVNAPWLDEPEKVQGREAAEARQAELHKAGPPEELEPVEGYAATVVVTIDGDKFTVTAGGREPETFDTVEEAEARQAELRAGEPPEGWTPEDAPEGGEQQGDTDVEGAGNEAPEDETVNDENKDKPVGGDKPNEPGTNQPNGAEVINDQKVAEGQTGGEGDDKDGTEGGDGTTGTVGP